MTDPLMPTRVVTPDKLARGWTELRGIRSEPRRYVVILALDDGNFLVEDPVPPPRS